MPNVRLLTVDGAINTVLIDPNSIQKTNILKVVCFSSCVQIWRTMNSDILQMFIIMKLFRHTFVLFIVTKSRGNQFISGHSAALNQSNSASSSGRNGSYQTQFLTVKSTELMILLTQIRRRQVFQCICDFYNKFRATIEFISAS